MKRTLLSALAVLLALGTLGAGAALAVDNPEMPYSQNVTVDNDTEKIRVLAENIDGDTASVTVSEVENHSSTGPNGTRSTTQVATGTLDTSTSTTDTYTFAAVDPANVSTYQIDVDGTSSMASLEVERLVAVGAGGMVGGSGSLFGDMSETTLGGIALLAVVFGWAVMRDD